MESLSGSLPSTISMGISLLNLEEFYLGSNRLSGEIPSYINNASKLTLLQMQNNSFGGYVPNFGDTPSSIGNPQSIEFLSLAHNKFEGSIPESLKDIINLRLLDLSNNNLSGVIPKSLKSLRYLEYFNVYCNKLEGEIPTEGPFVNFKAQSFIQNSTLCGATRFHVPLCARTHKISRPKNVSTLLVNYHVIISTIILVVIIIVLIRRRRRRKHNKVPPPTNISLGIGWRRISYQELVHGTSAFSEANVLGRRRFGSIFRGILSDGLNVAIKVFNLQLEGASKSFDIESEILSTVRHRNLIRIIGCCCNTEFKALILAYMPNGSLEKWLYSESYCLDILQRVKIAVDDIVLGLEYIHYGHTFPVVHCDMMSSNILLDEDMTAHVVDFGLSKLFDDGEVVIQTNTLATIGYTAPEYGSEGKVSTNGDVYSYGILLLEMFTMKKPTNDMFSGEMS
ncbi:hypothetical protein BUALT_Bualt10G0098400 [Buddleja alternifolia]|uniref:Protein kinase domain-containing protein n=1 Tax=Buddleja alternifolia TaxID=168488 RepID=A0AAV6X642_9LAMI|nr:hypothetical protein BUALT_Bualt10G0098400 [Buddleja alternifolia]